MKAAVLLLSLLVSQAACAGYPEAIKIAKEGNYRIFLMFTADWCDSCDTFKKTVLADPTIQKYLREHYVVCTVNVDQDRATADLYRSFLKGIPTCFVIDGNAVVYSQLSGAKGKDTFWTWITSVVASADPKERARDDFKRGVDSYVGMTGRLVVEGNRNAVVYLSSAGVMLFVVDIAEKNGKWYVAGRSRCLPELDKK